MHKQLLSEHSSLLYQRNPASGIQTHQSHLRDAGSPWETWSTPIFMLLRWNPHSASFLRSCSTTWQNLAPCTRYMWPTFFPFFGGGQGLKRWSTYTWQKGMLQVKIELRSKQPVKRAMWRLKFKKLKTGGVNQIASHFRITISQYPGQ